MKTKNKVPQKKTNKKAAELSAIMSSIHGTNNKEAQPMIAAVSRNLKESLPSFPESVTNPMPDWATLTEGQCDAMTIEQKAAMFDELQEHFISHDGVPFTRNDASAYLYLRWAADELCDFDPPYQIIFEQTKHIDKMAELMRDKENNNLDNRLDIGFSLAIINMCNYLNSGEEYIRYRRDARKTA